MSDLIDRKAAIDAIRASTSKYTGFMEMEMYTDDDAVEAIEALPSAQPYTDEEIQKIQELEEAQHDKIHELAYQEGKADAMRWIPCSERLPHTNGIYIVTRRISDGFECRNITDSCYFDGSNTWHDDTRVNHERKYLTDVVAWHELPEPWRGANE